MTTDQLVEAILRGSTVRRLHMTTIDCDIADQDDIALKQYHRLIPPPTPAGTDNTPNHQRYEPCGIGCVHEG